MANDYEDGPGPKPHRIEQVLAEQANAAIKAGADPAKVSERLSGLVSFARKRSDLSDQAHAAIQAGADPSAVSGRLYELSQEPEPKVPLLTRLADAYGNIIHEIRHNPIGVAKGLVEAPVRSMAQIGAPSMTEAARGENVVRGHYDRFGEWQPERVYEPITGKQRAFALLQTAANVAAPMLPAAPILGGAVTGAAYSREDPMVGAIVGASAGAAIHGVAKGAQAVTNKTFLPGTQGRIKILEAMEQAGVTPEDVAQRITAGGAAGKPMTIIEGTGKPMVRLARTVRSASPKADQELTSAFAQRAEGTADRAINDLLETTGIQKRSDAFQTTQRMIEDRAKEADQGYGTAFKNEAPVTDARVQEVLNTPAGQEAWKRAQRTMRNKGLKVPTGPGMQPLVMDGVPIMKNGAPVMVPSGEGVPTPTLQQLHYVKLALDDLMDRNLDRGPGAGGIGYNEGVSVLEVQRKLLDAMDEHSPEYAQARSQYADKSALIRANDMGRKLFTMQPHEAEAVFKELGTDAERDVFRRAGADALAERLENGPADPTKAASKIRDQRRIRLLFPDDAAFEQFKQRIEHEGNAIANSREITGGSQTADKLADLAFTLDLPVSEILNAAGGNPTGLFRVGGALAAKAAKMRMARSAAEEIAPILTAGARGDVAAQARVIAELAALRKARMHAPHVTHHALTAAHGAAHAASSHGGLLTNLQRD